jgi:hypothetical protein
VPYLNGSKAFTSSANLAFDGNSFLVGNPTAFTSVTVPGVLGVGGYGPFQYIGTNGATVLIDTGVSFALQNSTVFSGNNGTSSQRLNSIVANPRISNSGAGGSAAVLAGAITGIPLVSSSGTGGVLTVSGVIGHGARNQALDTSQATSNVIRGASLTARHDGALPSTAVSGLVHGADGFSFNQTGTVTVQSGFLVRVGVGGADTGPVANATSTTVAQFNGEVFIVGVASSAFTATVTDGYGVRLVGPEVAATGTMTNYYAVFASAPTVTGTLTNRWGVYMADSLSPNYFAGNVLVGGTSAPGQGVVYMANAAVVPASNPTGGGVLYVEGGALKYRGSSGTITTIANA